MKIGILLTNPDRSAFAQRYPNDGQKFAAKLALVRPHWDYQVVPVVDGEFPASVSSYDAYVLTGSPASVNDNEPWIARLEQFLQDAFAANLPMVGLCFGHQMLAKVLGGVVGRPSTRVNHGWGLLRSRL
jgi:GMP synthase-like glutamine amidotransferase